MLQNAFRGSSHLVGVEFLPWLQPTYKWKKAIYGTYPPGFFKPFTIRGMILQVVFKHCWTVPPQEFDGISHGISSGIPRWGQAIPRDLTKHNNRRLSSKASRIHNAIGILFVCHFPSKTSGADPTDDPHQVEGRYHGLRPPTSRSLMVTRATIFALTCILIPFIPLYLGCGERNPGVCSSFRPPLEPLQPS